MKKKIVSFLLVGTMLLSVVGCGSKSTATGSGDASGDTAVAGEYTFREVGSSLNTWSPTDWQLSNEYEILGYTTSALWDFTLDESSDTGYSIVPSMATDYPEDVSDEYAGNETYGVPESADAGSGYAYKVTLRDDITWEDGTPITTADLEYSMQQFLNPEMSNYRASTFFDGSCIIANAKSYFEGGKACAADTYSSMSDLVKGDDGVYTTASGDALYFPWNEALSQLDSASWSDYVGQGYGIDDWYEDFLALGDSDGNVPVTDESIAILYAYTSSDEWGNETEDDLLNYMMYDTAATSWDEVGLEIIDDYTFVIILQNPCTEFYFEYGFAPYFLNEELYEANKSDSSGILKSSYGTSVDSYMSYGPYKIVSYQEGKEMKLEKNENWYGYSDSMYDGKYQTTGIEITQIDEKSTQMSMFLQGNLDTVTLDSEYVDDYSTSDYIYYTPQSYTAAFAFDTDLETLQSRESDGINKTIVTYEDFRKAFSLAIDRNDYVKSCTSGYDAAFGLLNDIYVYDPETMAKYRDTEEAQQVLCDIYDVDSVDDVTGYDVEEARELLQSAYDQCKADGLIDDDDVVSIDYHIYGSDTTYQKLVDYVSDALNTAAEGTDLEGRIEINLVEDQDFYNTARNGQDDLIREAWGGADMDPYSVLWCYCDPSTITEHGFDSDADVTLTVDGQEVTMSYYDWYVALCQGEYSTADTDTRNSILAQMEEALLSDYHVIPVAAYTQADLYSQRIILGSDTFVNSLVEFGGISDITYTMDDAEWAEYCAEQNNQLTY